MLLLIVRHADAGDSEEWAKTGRPDGLRPLSTKGVEQMRAAAKGLVALLPEVDLIVTSPYTRAAQTAEIILAAYGGKVAEETTRTLEPEEDPEKFEAWLREHADNDVVIAVGHEPQLGILATWLMTGEESRRVEMKKGSACLLEFGKRPKKGTGVLNWLMTPRQLMAQGGGS
jgi:phosphohistidine phosphatase